MNALRCLGLISLPLLIVAAAPRAPVEDLVRRGNTAFEAREYSQAIALFEQAEARTFDPGLVAFNKAAVLYQLALAERVPAEKAAYFHRAEEHYRCATDDPSSEPRRVLARFGLANSLLLGRPDQLPAVKEAVVGYRAVLRSAALDESLLTNARHNLEVAKLLLLKLQAKPNPDNTPPDQGGDEPKPPTKKDPPTKPDNPDEPMPGQKKPQPGEAVGEVKEGDKPIPTDRKEAGAGNQPKPLREEDLSPSMTRQESDRELEDADNKIEEAIKIGVNGSSQRPIRSARDR